MNEIIAVNWLVIFNLLTGNILDSLRTLHQTLISAGISQVKLQESRKECPFQLS
jgi:hypothetical protein